MFAASKPSAAAAAADAAKEVKENSTDASNQQQPNSLRSVLERSVSNAKQKPQDGEKQQQSVLLQKLARHYKTSINVHELISYKTAHKRRAPLFTSTEKQAEETKRQKRAQIMTPEPILDTPLSIATTKTAHNPFEARKAPEVASTVPPPLPKESAARLAANAVDDRPRDGMEIFRSNAWPTAKEQKRYIDRFHAKVFFIDVPDDAEFLDLSHIIKRLNGVHLFLKVMR